jgi:hypothetical protein
MRDVAYSQPKARAVRKPKNATKSAAMAHGPSALPSPRAQLTRPRFLCVSLRLRSASASTGSRRRALFRTEDVIMSSSHIEVAMHEQLWAGVDRKLQDAQLALDEMGRSLDPPEHTTLNVVLESAGKIIDTRWQDSFYGHVGTFLAKVRSVPSIIESCFGADRGSRPMKDWFDGLPPAEQTRRQAFSDQFRGDRQAFGRHDLTNERNVGEHRLGFPSVEGKVVGPFGKVHTASPVQRIPIAESRDFGDPGNDPALLWAATLPPRAIQPRWDQFTIGGKPLFPECRAYLTLAEQLADQARAISQRVHGTDSLSTPPAS